MHGTIEITRSEIEALARKWVQEQVQAVKPFYIRNIQTRGYDTTLSLEITWSTVQDTDE
jgi:hypothetical protein